MTTSYPENQRDVPHTVRTYTYEDMTLSDLIITGTGEANILYGPSKSILFIMELPREQCKQIKQREKDLLDEQNRLYREKQKKDE